MTETTASQTRRTLPLIWKGAGAAALLLGLALPGDAAQHQPTFITFDPPGSTSTGPSAITPGGVIIGGYADASGKHGFLRMPDGTFTTFDVPGASDIHPTSITPAGVITGWYADPNGSHGFVRALDGSIATFDAPQGFTMFGSVWGGVAPPPSINPTGNIAGTYSGDVGNGFEEHGFLKTPDGTFTTIDFPGASFPFTEAIAINPSGVIVGDYCDDTSCFSGFVRSPDGTFTRIDYPGCRPTRQNTQAIAINPDGAVAGFAFCHDRGFPRHNMAYFRAPDGTVTVFDPPGSQYTSPAAINPAGAITGYYWDGVSSHGFLRSPDGAITAFDPPGSTSTGPIAINPAGVITGNFSDANSVYHGFLRIP